MFLFFILFSSSLIFACIVQFGVSRIRRHIQYHKKVRFLYTLDSKGIPRDENSSFRSFINEADVRLNVGALKRVKSYLEKHFVLPKDFSFVTLILITIGLLFIAFNTSGFLHKPFFPLALLVMAVELGTVLAMLSKLRFLSQFDKVFPQFLESISRIYSVHPDLKQALLFSQKVLKDESLQKFLKEVNSMVAIGVFPTEAMEIIAERWQYDQLFYLVSAIRLHQRFGGNLSELFANKAIALTRNAQSKAAVKSALFQNKISAFVICLLVPAVFLLSFGLSTQYRATILTENTAKSLIVFAGIWWGVGVAVMWRTLRFRL